MQASAVIAFGVGLACAVWGSAAAAKAPPAVRFVYDRAASAADCPDKEIVLDAVKARLGFDPFREPSDIVIRASVSRTGDQLTATIVSSEGQTEAGERRLVSSRSDCSELGSAMELAVSIAIDPLSISRAPPAPPPPAPVTVVLSAPPAPPPPSRAEPSSPIFLVASGGAAGSVGALLAPSLGFLAGFGLASESWSVSLEGRADLPSSREVGGGRINLSALAATIAPCLHRGPFAGCALASAVALRGSGQDLEDAAQVTTSVFALGARAAFELPRTGTVALRAHLDVLSPITRTTLNVGTRPVWTSPSVSAALGVAVVVRFR